MFIIKDLKTLYFYKYINALTNVKSILNLEELEELLFKLDSFKRNNEKKLEIADNKRFVSNSIHLTIIFRCIILKFSFYIYQYNVSFCHLILFTLYQYKLLLLFTMFHKIILRIFVSQTIFSHTSFIHPFFLDYFTHLYPPRHKTCHHSKIMSTYSPPGRTNTMSSITRNYIRPTPNPANPVVPSSNRICPIISKRERSLTK